MEKQFIIDDIKLGESWRLFRIMGEFVDGVEALHDIGPAINFFGSARVQPEDPIYQKAELLARRFAMLNFAIITGGGGGIMEAANKGGVRGRRRDELGPAAPAQLGSRTEGRLGPASSQRGLSGRQPPARALDRPPALRGARHIVRTRSSLSRHLAGLAARRQAL